VDGAGNKIKTINPEQAKVVQQIFEWRAAGWSAMSVCRELNARGVPAPGASWKRKSTEPHRKNPTGDWLPSAVTGEPGRGVGILNNQLYRGWQIWGRSRWPVIAANSSIRKCETVDDSKWIKREVPELRIIDEALWKKVEAIQTAKNPRREAVTQGIAKRKLSDHARPFWLSSILVCECGANLIAYGDKDYCCPVFTARGRCSNDLRFRRAEVETELFALLKEQLLSGTSIARGTAFVEAWLTERATGGGGTP
jgi:site-specific DNA recombinase